MPKQKVHKGLKKRVRVSKGGKILRHKAGMSHLMSGKSGKSRRRLRRATVTAKSEQKRMKHLLGLA